VTEVTDESRGIRYPWIMKRNMGLLDRIIRVALVALVAVLYFTNQLSPVAAIILGVLAVVFLATSLVGTCPLYLLFGISTKRKPAA
jgi:hypothetical protein